MRADERGAPSPHRLVAGALALRDAGEHVASFPLDEAIEDQVAASRAFAGAAPARAGGARFRARRLGAAWRRLGVAARQGDEEDQAKRPEGESAAVHAP
jgi:hypothetical protein